MNRPYALALALLCIAGQATAADRDSIATSRQATPTERSSSNTLRASKAPPVGRKIIEIGPHAAEGATQIRQVAAQEPELAPDEKPSDPFAETADPKSPAGTPEDAPPDPMTEESPLADPGVMDEKPTRPGADVFELDPQAPRRTAPPSKSPPPRSRPQAAPPRARQSVPTQPPARSSTPARPRQSDAPEAAPPRMLPEEEIRPQPEYRDGEGTFDGEWFDGEMPYSDGPFDEGEYYDGCSSCAEAVASYGPWNEFYPRKRFPPCGTWATVDYLMWWGRGQSLPPLVTTGSTTGAMTDPNVHVLFGNERVDTHIRSGGRLNIGTWLDDEHHWGAGASFLQLQNVATNFITASSGSTLLARPFFNTTTSADDSEVIARAGDVIGGIRARTTSSFVAADAYLRQGLAYAPQRRIDLLYGWRYMQISDSLGIDDRTVSVNPSNPFVPLGTTITGRDEFRAWNQFNGGEIGLMTERRRGIWSLSTVGKVSLGNMHQTVVINGSSATTIPGEATTFHSGSLLAQPSNIGRYDRNVFAVVPEVTVNLGLQITPRLRGTFGYSLIYINRVVQSARQIDNAVDTNQFGGSTGTSPSFHFQQNNFWLQGMNFGLNYKF